MAANSFGSAMNWRGMVVGLGITAFFAIVLFAWDPSGLYVWLKAAHVVAVISWMAGMLYLPRLFVYHAGVPTHSQQSEVFKVMERRLLRAIVNPAMIATWVIGLWLASDGDFFSSFWLQAKLALVLVLSGLHGWLARWVRLFAEDRNVHSQRFYRYVNEVPTLLMILIVILVVVKPF